MKNSTAFLLLLSLSLVYLNLFASTEEIKGFCSGVADGDTLFVNINGRNETVRLIGIDTPEKDSPYTKEEYFGREASAFTERLVNKKNIILKFDMEKRDKYNRLLAYVYLPNGIFLNKYLVSNGIATAYRYFNYKYRNAFIELEHKAKRKCLGLWGEWCKKKGLKGIR